jgi:6-pyruvoyltetrahydropterin/6-carboxytetrahydropterin synthase
MQIGVRHVRATRRFHFDSAHKLVGYPGKCNQLHGHRWTLEVTIEEKVSSETGLSIDFGDIKDFVTEAIIDRLDHHYLNDILQTNCPTAEIIILWIWSILKAQYQETLYNLRLYESPDSWIDYDGGV